jgi:hypothetical protein
LERLVHLPSSDGGVSLRRRKAEDWGHRPGYDTIGVGYIEVVPIPHDCRHGFFHAYWRRPDTYLEPQVRKGMSVFSRLTPREVEEGVARLRADLESGEWHRRNAELLELEELDLGYRLFVAG